MVVLFLFSQLIFFVSLTYGAINQQELDFNKELQKCQRLNTDNLALWEAFTACVTSSGGGYNGRIRYYFSSLLTLSFSNQNYYYYNYATVSLGGNQVEVPFESLDRFWANGTNLFNDPLPQISYFNLSSSLEKYTYLERRRAATLLVKWADALEQVGSYVQSLIDYVNVTHNISKTLKSLLGIEGNTNSRQLTQRLPRNTQITWAWSLPIPGNFTEDAARDLIKSLNYFYIVDNNNTL